MENKRLKPPMILSMFSDFEVNMYTCTIMSFVMKSVHGPFVMNISIHLFIFPQSPKYKHDKLDFLCQHIQTIWCKSYYNNYLIWIILSMGGHLVTNYMSEKYSNNVTFSNKN